MSEEKPRIVKVLELGLGSALTGGSVEYPVLPGEEPPIFVMSPALSAVMQDIQRKREEREKKQENPEPVKPRRRRRPSSK